VRNLKTLFSGAGLLNPIFVRFSFKTEFQNRSGTCLNAFVVFVASNLHVEMAQSIVESIESKQFDFLPFNILKVPLPALRGEHIFEKCTPNKNQSNYGEILEVQ